VITSEKFYRAECDQEKCDRTLPDQDDDEASHWTHDTVVAALGEERGFLEVKWAVVGEKTYCPRHAPGNIDCVTCDALGMVKVPAVQTDAYPFPYKYDECGVCAGRGYLVPTASGDFA